jgi:hypothetical protein
MSLTRDGEKVYGLNGLIPVERKACSNLPVICFTFSDANCWLRALLDGPYTLPTDIN